jgi:hypothetical protein
MATRYSTTVVGRMETQGCPASDNIVFLTEWVGIRNCTKPCWVSGRVSKLINHSYKKIKYVPDYYI